MIWFLFSTQQHYSPFQSQHFFLAADKRGSPRQPFYMGATMSAIDKTQSISSDPILLPDTPGQLCQEPKAVVHLDEELGLCYELELPCGVSEDLAAERFREEHGLANNPAVRLQGPPPSPKNPSSSWGSSGSLSSEELLRGIIVYLGGL
jgi:hypothetical protein